VRAFTAEVAGIGSIVFVNEVIYLYNALKGKR
jgi:hypothetical protein